MKFERVKGNVPVFSGEYDGRDRTIFGGTTQSNDINQQFTPEFKKGWGIVGKNEFPTLQDFNALGFTHSALIGYLYQSGVAQWVAGADYYTGSVAVQGVDLYVAIQDKPTSAPNTLQGWRLVSPALLNTTGNSTSAPMTQKAVTDALAKKWDIQKTAGSGNVARMSEVQKKWDIQQTAGSGKVMREGAYGVGDKPGALRGYDYENDDPRDLPDGFSLHYGTSGVNNPTSRDGLILTTRWGDWGMQWKWGNGNRVAFSAVENNDRGRLAWCELYHTGNTRTDKNNVLHSGTSTPINTLNVSDMAQDVVNRDDMTVTSGAVYRGLGKKWDIQKTTGSGNVARMSEVEKKITGGSVVQKTGTSTVNVISQKAFTDLSFGIGQTWKDMTSQRAAGTTYTNNTGKPIMVSILSDTSVGVNLRVDGVLVGHGRAEHAYQGTVYAIIPSGSSYAVSGRVTGWAELR